MEESLRRPVLVVVGAGWCGVCNASTPSVEALAKKYEERISTVVVDTEKEPEMKEYLSTGRIPLFLLIRNREVVQAQEGFSDPSDLEAMIRRGLPQEL